jgi:hypothetical protein
MGKTAYARQPSTTDANQERERLTPGEAPQTETVPRKRGRKPGKHSDESYTQTSLYLPRELRNKVRARLYERGMEMSGLVENMLREWLSGETHDSRR